MIQTKEATKISFPKYPAYKDSGVEWLGEIPEGWNTKKLKFIGKIYAGLNGKKGDDFSKEFNSGMKPFIPFTNIFNNFKIDDSKYQFVKIGDFENQNLVKTFDLLFLMSSETIEDIGKCSLYDGLDLELYLNSFCKGFRLTSSEAHAYFTNYLLKGTSYRKYFSIVGRGFTRINIKQEYVNDLVILLPPLPEQTAIASFLDDKTAKIDKAIAQKEKLIALLKERKQIVIQNAVTGKLKMDKGQWIMRPKNEMKDSGVEWIGEIPEGWEVKKVKHVTSKIGSGITPAGGGTTYLGEGGMPLLRSQNIHFGRIDLNDVARISPKIHESMSNSKVQKGDVLLNITGGSIGRCHYVETENEMNVNQHVCIVRPNTLIDTKYLNNLLASEIGQGQIWFFQQGGGREGLNFQALKNFLIPLPSQQERKNILIFLENKISMMNESITLQQIQIAKLKEYKQH